MPVGPLRKASQDWAHETFIEPDPNTWWGRVVKRWNEAGTLIVAIRANHPIEERAHNWGLAENQFLYAITGSKHHLDYITKMNTPPDKDEVQKAIAAAMDGIFKNPAAATVVESIGTVITEPIFDLFEQYAGDDQTDPKKFARAFHGFMIGLNLSSGLASTLIEAATLGQVKGAGKMIDQLYWSLGLGFLGWQTLAPLLSEGLQPGLERYYKRLYRPKRFAASDLRDLYALGQVPLSAVYEEGRNEGWRDKDLDQWVKLAFRSLSQGDIFDAFHKGFIDQGEAVKRLRVLGYDPADIPLLFQINPAPEVTNARSLSVSQASKAYQDGLLGLSELKSVLKGLKYDDLAIATIVALADLAIAQSIKSLSIGQVKAAWGDNVINDTEARHYLAQEGLAGAQIDIILKTWQAELTPTARKLNAGTIGSAYVEGILTRSQAGTKLGDLGYTTDDVKLQLDLIEARNPEAFGAAPPPKVRTLAPGTLAGLVAVGLITAEQMQTRLIALGYAQADAELLAQAAAIKAATPAKILPQASVENAYVSGVLTRPKATSYLKALGYDDATAGVILDTDEQKNAGIFKQPPAQRTLSLSAGTLSDLLLLGIIDAGQMNTYLLALGYSDSDAALLTARAQNLATPLPRILTADNVRQAYLFGVINRGQAEGKLEDIDYSQADAETILNTLEAQNPQVFHPELVQSIRMPSITALATAVYNRIISESDFYARAQELVYAPEDAKLYLRPAVNGSHKPTQQLSAAQVLAAYDKGLFDYENTLNRLEALGFNEADAIILIRTRKDQIRNTDAWFSLMTGSIDPDSAIAQLIASGYSDADIVAAFASLSPATLSAMGIDLTALAAALPLTPVGAQ